MNTAQGQSQDAELRPGQRVEIVHHMQVGSRATESRTVGTLIGRRPREGGIDSGYRRSWDEKQWFDHWYLRKDDGELTSVTLDQFTTVQQQGEIAEG
jgi:hypothetical protein